MVVVDEASMVDVPLMAALTESIGPNAGLVLIGDVDQLPSVGPGQVLADVIHSGLVPVARLTEIFRQAEESRIVVNAHRINRGERPEPPTAGRRPTSTWWTPQARRTRWPRPWKSSAPGFPGVSALDAMRDVQVITPMQKGLVGARNLNDRLAELLNPAPIDRVERFGQTYAVGDKVMQIENDYDRDVFNGDPRRPEAHPREGGRECVVSFDGRDVSYGLQDLEALQRAYPSPSTRARAEYPAVVVPMVREHSIMLARNLLYTAPPRQEAGGPCGRPWALDYRRLRPSHPPPVDAAERPARRELTSAAGCSGKAPRRNGHFGPGSARSRSIMVMSAQAFIGSPSSHLTSIDHVPFSPFSMRKWAPCRLAAGRGDVRRGPAAGAPWRQARVDPCGGGRGGASSPGAGMAPSGASALRRPVTAAPRPGVAEGFLRERAGRRNQQNRQGQNRAFHRDLLPPTPFKSGGREVCSREVGPSGNGGRPARLS